MLKVLKNRNVAIAFIAFVVIFGSLTVNMMNLPLAIIHELGGSKRDFGIVFGIGPLVEIPMMIWFGFLASRGHQTRLVQFGFILAILYFVGLSFSTAVWHIYLLQILSGVLISINANIGITFFQDLVPDQPGLTTALYSNAMATGNLIGMLSFGVIVEASGYHGVFVTCAVLSVIATAIIMFFRQESAQGPSIAQSNTTAA